VIADLNELIKLVPNSDGYLGRGAAYLARAIDLAIADFNEMVKRDPKHFEPYINRGEALRQKGWARGAKLRPAPAADRDSAQAAQGRLASVRAELLPPLPPGRAPRPAHRRLRASHIGFRCIIREGRARRAVAPASSDRPLIDGSAMCGGAGACPKAL
jgi:tetratricopeptide (TPR) repeat protein